MFAQITRTISADLKTPIEPCQFGGRPDCSSCGCMASAALAAVGDYRLAGLVPLASLFRASVRVGQALAREQASPPLKPAELKIVR
jgi:hypothetical protein